MLPLRYTVYAIVIRRSICRESKRSGETVEAMRISGKLLCADPESYLYWRATDIMVAAVSSSLKYAMN